MTQVGETFPLSPSFDWQGFATPAYNLAHDLKTHL